VAGNFESARAGRHQNSLSRNDRYAAFRPVKNGASLDIHYHFEASVGICRELSIYLGFIDAEIRRRDERANRISVTAAFDRLCRFTRRTRKIYYFERFLNMQFSLLTVGSDTVPVIDTVSCIAVLLYLGQKYAVKYRMDGS
jgi:hypothetical protein